MRTRRVLFVFALVGAMVLATAGTAFACEASMHGSCHNDDAVKQEHWDETNQRNAPRH